MKKSRVWLPTLLGLIIILSYSLNKLVQGFYFNIYYLVLFLIPLILIFSKKLSLKELGIRLGNPIKGIFFVLLLPIVLYFRFRLAGRQFSPPDFLPVIILGSIAEEFFFRGYLQEDFKKQLNGNIWLGLVFSNLFFALTHLVKGYSIFSVLMIFVIGFYFGVTKDKQGGDSLIYSTLAHILYNFVVSSFPSVY